MTAMEVHRLHERLGKVASQPINVTSFTNKRLTINFRAPLDRLRRLIPDCLETEEIGNTGMGMISQRVLFMEKVPQVWGGSWLYAPYAAVPAIPDAAEVSRSR